MDVSNSIIESIKDQFYSKKNIPCQCEDKKILEDEVHKLKKDLKESNKKVEILTKEKIGLLKAVSISHKFGTFYTFEHIFKLIKRV